MSLIQAIPTVYKGVQFRSRLEARWAVVFDLLRWPWTYEPFELKDYIPDFIVAFEDGIDLLVEIKPFVRLDEAIWRPVQQKIDSSGWIGGYNAPPSHRPPLTEMPAADRPCGADCNDCGCCLGDNAPEVPRPALILGATIWSSDEADRWTHTDHAIVGYMRDDSVWPGADWGPAQIITCNACRAVFPYQDGGERTCRRCGCDDKHYYGKRFPIEDYLNRAKNDMQWRPRQ